MPLRTTRALTKLARSQQTTVNVVLQGAWALLLSSLCGHGDVAFGTTVSGRGRRCSVPNRWWVC
ncbi:condensation domain-containing protein [Mycobacteroides abscessus]|nr:condensation domain-containing protein [Mycobacteroides abscessus]